ncbi:hypothetical protein [Bacteriovorax sp. Seq25_V]|uniref:hypothetical protein n=1 Tax=Bacteriovorax sp. Seq25_V TaxID=1201288 RepID=UPI00038A54BD|nr:hypothetical protein [Bacteriovorax sp. Seq25_V]EQC46620.1 hypothetical protein M900_2414 [Bacteriovorax sp. Seq25_V]
MFKLCKKITICTLLLGQVGTWAQDLSYPELQVTPKASERLKMLAADENETGLIFQMPFQVSAASTLVAGLMQFSNVDEQDDPDKKSPLAGVVVGGAWLGINYYLGHHYNIYQRTLKDVNRVTGNSQRDQLTRERYAEEGMNSAARLAKKLKWMSAITNLAANTYMLTNVKKDSTSEIIDGVAILAALGPLFFETTWEQVWRDQKSYKKKIYGPIVSTSVFSVEDTFVPGLSLSLKF